jgi:hypothetical protein
MALDVYQFKIIGHDPAGRAFENCFHFAPVSTPAGDPFTVAGQLGTAIWTAISANYLASLGNNAEIDAWACKRVNNGGGPTYLFIVDTAGTAGVPVSVAGLGYCLGFAPAAGYSRWGRIIMPAPPDNAWVDGLPTDSYVSQVNSFAANLVASFTAGTVAFSLCIYSRKTGIPHAINTFNGRVKATLLNKREKPPFGRH